MKPETINAPHVVIVSYFGQKLAVPQGPVGCGIALDYARRAIELDSEVRLILWNGKVRKITLSVVVDLS